MKENYFLDDGAYLATKLLGELAKAQLENKLIIDLIADLKEPVESQEFRLKINLPDFQEYGDRVITELQEFAATQSDWLIVPNNYEGVRIACQSPEESGWFLLRLSLHDPVIPLNIESDVTGGVKKIASRLSVFLQKFASLDLSPLSRE
jgi:phosphomannomutase